MSDVPAGSVSLEEDPTAAAPPVEAPATDPPPAPAAPADDADPDGTIEGSGGVKFVPLSALAAARQAAREAKAEVAALKPKAERVDQIVSEWRDAQPLLERAKQLVTNPPPSQKPAGPLSADEAIEYAKDFDLYKADGTPDVDRAQRIAARHESWADKRAEAKVAPLIQHTAQGQSRANFEQAANFKHPQTGLQVDRGILEQAWNSVPAELSAQPNVAAVLWNQAVSQTVLQGKWKGVTTPPPPPAAHNESLGGSHTGPAALNSIDHQLRIAADMSEKQFTETRDRYKPGAINSLE